jgi:hypothetical protein
MLRLHKGYSIPLVINTKLAQQYAGPFKILEWIGRLAYRLELLLHWEIHPVILIAYLELKKPNLFNRLLPKHPSTMHVEEDTDKYQFFLIEKLINK